MKIITKNEAVSFQDRNRTPGTAGIYALVDPVTGVPRYVGPTQHAEHRLYAHMAGMNKRRPSAKDRWLAELKAAGRWPELWLLEEFDVGPQQGEKRHEAERRWIGICQELMGGADMNTALTPVGHANSKDSSGKKLQAELVLLRARVAELEREHAALCGLVNATLQHDVQLAQKLRDAQLQKVQCNATPPYGGVAVLH